MAFKYFLYSELQIKEKNNILAKSGKEFVPGTVVINGKRQKFTQLSDTAKMPRYIDTKVVASGEYNDFTVVKPSTIIKNKR